MGLARFLAGLEIGWIPALLPLLMSATVAAQDDETQRNQERLG